MLRRDALLQTDKPNKKAPQCGAFFVRTDLMLNLSDRPKRERMGWLRGDFLARSD